VQTSRPWGKFEILAVLGAVKPLYSHICATINVKFGTVEWTLPRAKFHIYRGNVSPLWGNKPIFGPLRKNDTGMGVLST